MDWIKVLEALRSPKLLLAIALVSGASLFVPKTFRDAIGFEPLIAAYRHWIGVALLVSCAFLFIEGCTALCKSLRARRERNRPQPYEIGSFYIGKYDTITYLPHRGAMWHIRAPRPEMYSGQRANFIDVATTPHCPKCTTELGEEEMLFGRSYRWSCVRCPFSVENKVSFADESVVVKKLARSDRYVKAFMELSTR